MNYLGIEFEAGEVPALDPDFLPLGKWMTAFERQTVLPVSICLTRPTGEGVTYQTALTGSERAADLAYLFHCVKFLLWSVGASRVRVAAAPPLPHKEAQKTYKKCTEKYEMYGGVASPEGAECYVKTLATELAERFRDSFDENFMSTIFGEPFSLSFCRFDRLPPPGAGQIFLCSDGDGGCCVQADTAALFTAASNTVDTRNARPGRPADNAQNAPSRPAADAPSPLSRPADDTQGPRPSCPPPAAQSPLSRPAGIKTAGCRIGFDAGGSDYKVAAVQDGRVLFSEETAWSPKTATDPDYHYGCIVSALQKAASYLPRVDAIGVSTAGVVVGDRVVISSLFAAVPPEKMAAAQTVFRRAAAALGAPLTLANDGDVAALAAATAPSPEANSAPNTAALLSNPILSAEGNSAPNVAAIPFNSASFPDAASPKSATGFPPISASPSAAAPPKNTAGFSPISAPLQGVLGLALGTAEAAGYVNLNGALTGWLNELSFAPLDLQPHAPTDPWSGAKGVGSLYLSQDGVLRLANRAGLAPQGKQTLAQKLEEVQRDPRSDQVFEGIGCYLGHAILLYARFYPLKSVFLQGRVLSGRGGELILRRCRKIVVAENPALSAAVRMPDEHARRLGQAVAAAGL